MKLPKSVQNWLSAIGAAFALFCAIVILVLSVFSYFFAADNPYLGLFIFLIIPGFLVLGLLMIPVGMYIKIRQDKKRGLVQRQRKVRRRVEKYRKKVRWQERLRCT